MTYKIEKNRRAKFKDLVQFVDYQARILSHPVFGNLKEIPTVTTKTNYSYVPGASSRRNRQNRSGFATGVSPIPQTAPGHSDKSPCTKCMYCQREHSLVTCQRILKKTHKEKLEFLRTKGLCFGCLGRGHMSKGCKQRLTCKECSLKHPTILHIANTQRITQRKGAGCCECFQCISGHGQK